MNSRPFVLCCVIFLPRYWPRVKVTKDKTEQNKVLEYEILINNYSKHDKKWSNSELFWLGDMYITLMKPLQLPIGISQRM